MCGRVGLLQRWLESFAPSEGRGVTSHGSRQSRVTAPFPLVSAQKSHGRALTDRGLEADIWAYSYREGWNGKQSYEAQA